ncbi:MAG TPA: DEAD/DEAH box helicase, partial [Bacteroidales bacterium]|nr:DEAD/DEAH box helicase [Bacteroidales bacterium]
LLDRSADIIALAQTGTGKTAAFGIPVVQLTDPQNKNPQTVILAPTRELCVQIANDLISYARYMKQIRILAVYGGSSIETQIRELKKGVHILVATPGRLIDLMERRAAKLLDVSTVVLDEADEMLNMGFLDSINTILAGIPDTRQTLLFSATMPSAIASIANRYMKDPAEVVIGTKNSGADQISHTYYMVRSRDKYEMLKRIADAEPTLYGIVFCRTRRETHEIATRLISDGYNADALHGDLSQQQRDTVMQKFRLRNITILVATDVAARGLDMTDLTHIIHFSVPENPQVYTHRSGRTGRAGKKGTSVLLVQPKDKPVIRMIQNTLKTPLTESKIPGAEEIFGKRLSNWIQTIRNTQTSDPNISALSDEVCKQLDDLTREDLIRRLMALELKKFSGYQNPSFEPEERKSRIKHRQEPEDYDFTRLFVNAGKMDGLNNAELLGIINRNTHGKKIALGKIDIKKRYSFFEVESKKASEMIHILNKVRFRNRDFRVQKAGDHLLKDFPKSDVLSDQNFFISSRN